MLQIWRFGIAALLWCLGVMAVSIHPISAQLKLRSRDLKFSECKINFARLPITFTDRDLK